MYSTRVSQHIRAPRAAVYRALVDPDAIAHWRVPAGMTSKVHQFDAREGGAFRVTLSYDAPTDTGTGPGAGAGAGTGKSAAHSDTYRGRFVRLVPDELVVEIFEFETDNPDLQGEMTLTTRLSEADGGTDVTIVHAGVPDSVPVADNETGTRMALANLAALVQNG